MIAHQDAMLEVKDLTKNFVKRLDLAGTARPSEMTLDR